MRNTLLFFLVLTTITIPAQAEETVRVNVLSLLSPKEVAVETVGIIRYQDASGSHSRLAGGETLHVNIKSGGAMQLILGSMQAEVSAVWIKPADAASLHVRITAPQEFQREYAGELKITAAGEQLQLILTTRLENVVLSSAAREFASSEEVLQSFLAGVVCIRSFLMVRKQESLNSDFDIYDHTGDVFFTGQEGLREIMENPVIKDSIQEVEGYILTAHGKIVPGFFSTACGGHTLDITRVWGAGSYSSIITGVRCHWCSESPFAYWSTTLPVHEVLDYLDLEELPDRPLDWTVADGMVFIGQQPDPEASITTESFRLAIGRERGWDVVKSNHFQLSAWAGMLRIYGWGRGHNVGLCQHGAEQMAREKYSWQAILRFYFPDCNVENYIN